MLKYLPFNRKELLYCGLEKQEYESVRDIIIERNVSLVTKIAGAMIVLGFFFLGINALLGSDNLVAYWILVAGGLILCFWRLAKRDLKGIPALIYCFGPLITVYAYDLYHGVISVFFRQGLPVR